MNLNELKDRAYKIAKSHGWHDKELSDETYLMLIITEIAEAVQADRKGIRPDIEGYKEFVEAHDETAITYAFKKYIKGCVEEELADACIRLLDLAGLRNCELLYMDSLYIGEISFTEFSYMLCSFITNPNKSQKDWLKLHISCSLGRIFSLCKQKGIDIFWHIEQKIKYNDLRPYKHGGRTY